MPDPRGATRRGGTAPAPGTRSSGSPATCAGSEELDRVAAGADPDAAAALPAGACFQQAFLRYFAEGTAASPVPDTAFAALAAALARALSTP